MPEMDGLALAATLADVTAPKPLPVVVVSSRGDREAASANVVAWLTKPVKPSPLLDALHGLLAAVTTETPTAPVAEVETLLGDRHPLRILLAEDNAVNQKLALRLLQQLGYGAKLAGNGLEAIAALEAATFDLVLMDVQMPELDGLEATRRIRARWPAGAGPRIAAMTANAMAGDRELCLAAGMDDYISKPIRAGRAAGDPRGDAICRDVGHSMPEVLDQAMLDNLIEMVGGDPEFVDELVDTFREDVPQQLAELRRAVDAGAVADVVRPAHTLKGNSPSIGARSVASYQPIDRGARRARARSMASMDDWPSSRLRWRTSNRRSPWLAVDGGVPHERVRRADPHRRGRRDEPHGPRPCARAPRP